jgi:hypothetical protein
MNENEPKCLVCQKTGQEIPLIELHYQDQQYWICPSDFPTLIHNPKRLVGKLPGAENLVPHEH